MTENTAPPRPRLLHMDFLRGLAILYIVGVRHLDDYAGGAYHNKIDDVITYVFLGLFVFISGYFLSITSPIENRKDLHQFFVKRFLRVYPLYILALFLFVICSLMSFKSLLLHMFCLNIVLGNSVMTLWFVTMICVLYISYPIIIYQYSLLKTLIIYLVVFSVVELLHKLFGLFDIRLLIFFPLFLFGIVFLKHNLNKYFHKKHTIVFSMLLFFMALFLYYETNHFRRLFFILFMMSPIPFLLFIGEKLSTTINETVIYKIAYASFSMYLFHRVIFTLITNIYSPENDIYMLVYLTLLGLPIIFGISYFLQKYYDRLTIQWRQV